MSRSNHSVVFDQWGGILISWKEENGESDSEYIMLEDQTVDSSFIDPDYTLALHLAELRRQIEALRAEVENLKGGGS